MDHSHQNEHSHTEGVRVHGGGTGYSLKDFAPLIGILVVICIATYISVTTYGMEGMLAFMGWFFVVFGALKVLKLKGFVEAYQMYDVVAKRSKAYAYLYPFLELGFGLAYLTSWKLVSVSWVVLVVMLVSALGVYLKLRQKEEIPCACLGTVFKVPMTWVTLGEDLLMAVMAALIIFG